MRTDPGAVAKSPAGRRECAGVIPEQVIESEPMSKACPKCGAANAESARFCRQCGAGFDPAETPGAAASLVACRQCGHPNRRGVAICARCGADQRLIAMAAAFGPATRRRPSWALGAALAAALSVLVIGAWWWFSVARAASGPTFDSAPPPSMLGARGVGVLAPEPQASAASAVAAVASSGAGAAVRSAEPDVAASVASAPVAPSVRVAPAAPVEPATPVITDPAPTERPVTRRAAPPVAASVARPVHHATNDAAIRPAAPAVRRDPPRTAPDTAPVAAVPSRPVTAGNGSTVAERCDRENMLMRSLCEARECFSGAHAADPACQRIKAAGDRRRQREERGG